MSWSMLLVKSIANYWAGLFKSNIVPTVIDQYPHHKSYVDTLPSGERIIVDVESTIQRE